MEDGSGLGTRLLSRWLHGFTHRSFALKAHLVLAVRTGNDFLQRRVMDKARSTLSLVENLAHRVKTVNTSQHVSKPHCGVSAVPKMHVHSL